MSDSLSEDYGFEAAAEAAAAIRERIAEAPRVAVVLGSGLGPMADGLADRTTIPYGVIPRFPAPTVDGHAGNLAVGRLGAGGRGPRAILLQGRFHYYEGHHLDAVVFPVRVLFQLGVRTLILTAAVGGIRPGLVPGGLVCLSDHLNLLGANPLRGPNDDRFGPRFADMTEVYSKRLREIAAEAARTQNAEFVEGVYACLPGPSYETPAEIRMLRALGADVVGMSTVPEAVAARHCGMEVLAIALVTNSAAGVGERPIDHHEVVDEGRKAAPGLARIIEAVVERCAIDAP